LAEREAETRRIQAKFDVQLAEMYAKVADEYPGERKKKGAPDRRPSVTGWSKLGSLNQYPGRAHSQPG